MALIKLSSGISKISGSIAGTTFSASGSRSTSLRKINGAKNNSHILQLSNQLYTEYKRSPSLFTIPAGLPKSHVLRSFWLKLFLKTFNQYNSISLYTYDADHLNYSSEVSFSFSLFKSLIVQYPSSFSYTSSLFISASTAVNPSNVRSSSFLYPLGIPEFLNGDFCIPFYEFLNSLFFQLPFSSYQSSLLKCYYIVMKKNFLPSSNNFLSSQFTIEGASFLNLSYIQFSDSTLTAQNFICPVPSPVTTIIGLLDQPLPPKIYTAYFACKQLSPFFLNSNFRLLLRFRSPFTTISARFEPISNYAVSETLGPYIIDAGSFPMGEGYHLLFLRFQHNLTLIPTQFQISFRSLADPNPAQFSLLYSGICEGNFVNHNPTSANIENFDVLPSLQNLPFSKISYYS